jgi:hypothetical protein
MELEGEVVEDLAVIGHVTLFDFESSKIPPCIHVFLISCCQKCLQLAECNIKLLKTSAYINIKVPLALRLMCQGDI